MGWSATGGFTDTELTSWQTLLRQRITQLVGGIHNVPAIDLKPVVLNTSNFAGYRREFVRMQSRPGLDLCGYMLIPNATGQPLPAVVCLPGHGRGVDSIVGIAEDGSQRPLGSPAEYQMDFALQCVEKGYAVFALEQISFGHRRDSQARASGPGTSSCSRDSTTALMLGDTMTGWRVWDTMRAIDYLQTRPEVDPSRIATMGISGGGLTSLFAACLDERVKCSIVSGYFNTFVDSVLSINHCVDNYIPGILNVAEMPELTALIAPRALFAESGKTDHIFPLAAFHRAIEQAESIYERFGVRERLGWETFDAGHEFYGKGAFQFMERNL